MNFSAVILLLVLFIGLLDVAVGRRLKRLPARFHKRHGARYRSGTQKRHRQSRIREDSIQDTIMSTADLYKLIKTPASARDDVAVRGTTRREVRLYCRVGIGYHLEINKNGKVVARHQASDDGRLVIFSLERGVVGIESVKYKRYLCMNKKGKLITRGSFRSDCSFREKIEGNKFNSYASEKFSKNRKGYFMAISRRGKPKRGRHVSWREKKAHWLTRGIRS